MDMTPIELSSILNQLPRINYESAMYEALAFNDPQKLGSELQEIHDKNLSPREKWERGIAKLKEAVGR